MESNVDDLASDVEDVLEDFEIHHVFDITNSKIAKAIAEDLIKRGWVK